VQIAFVAGFLKVVLQLFLRLAAALTYGPHLLRCRSGVGVLVRATIARAVSALLTHAEIVSPYVSVGKAPRTTAGGPAVVRLSLAPGG
jgi:hypothetical protein